MDQETFAKLIHVLARTHEGASEFAVPVFGLLLLAATLCGALTARWIFQGGLSRARPPAMHD